MYKLFVPHLRLAGVLDLQVRRLRGLGIEGVLLDLDNTLKDHGAGMFRAEVVAWTRRLRAEGLRLCIMSNGRPRRIAAMARQPEIPFVARAFKPLPFGCHAALRKLGLRRGQVALVGDQIFADVLAGRLAGLYTIPVRPTSPEEPWFTRLKRPLERRTLGMLPEVQGDVEIPPASTQTEEVTP